MSRIGSCSGTGWRKKGHFPSWTGCFGREHHDSKTGGIVVSGTFSTFADAPAATSVAALKGRYELTKMEGQKVIKVNLELIPGKQNALLNATEPCRLQDLDEISREYMRLDRARKKLKKGRLTGRVDKSIQVAVEELALKYEVSKTDIFEGIWRKTLTSPEIFKRLSSTVQAALTADSSRRGFNQ